MGELSDRFAALMARMAKSDAELFRAIGNQNASIRLMVDELALAGDNGTAPTTNAAIAPATLLPPAQCDQKELKARFGKIAEAQAWIEGQIGQAPKKPTWLVIEQTCRSGSWPAAPVKASAASKGITPEQLEVRLTALEEKLTQRFDRLEGLLLLIAESNDRPSLVAGERDSPVP